MIRKILLGLLLVFLALLALILFWPEKAYKPYIVDAKYQAQVDVFNVPDMPSDWVWKKFETQDGTTLRWGETGNAQAAKASIIWIPGYTATVDMYGEHIHHLAQEGYHIIGLDLRGQGGSQRFRAEQPEKLWVDDFSTYAQDVSDFITHQTLPAERPLILLGISFGGHVAIRTLIDHKPASIDGLYLMAPAIRPKSGEYSFEEARRMMNIARRLGKSKQYVLGETDWRPDGTDFTQGSDCSSHPARLYYRDVLFTRRPELRVGGVTNQWGAEFFESSDMMSEAGYLEQLDVPVTIISADHDTFVETEVNSQACDNRIKNCHERRIDGTGHCLLQEDDAVLEVIFSEIDTLLARLERSQDH